MTTDDSKQPEALGLDSAEVADISREDEFVALAVEKGLMPDGEFRLRQRLKILAALRPYPAFFFYACQILRRRAKPFSIGLGGFESALSLADGSPARAKTFTEYTRATRDIVNDEEFDGVWAVLNDRSNTEVPPQGADDFVKRVLAVYRKFRELVGKIYFPHMNFFEMEVMIRCSKEPKHDFQLIVNLEWNHQVKAADLEAYYETHHYICHPHFWGPASVSQSVSSEEITIREKMSRMKHYPPFAVQDKIVKELRLIWEEETRTQMISLMEVMLDQKLPYEHFEHLARSVRGKSLVADPQAETQTAADPLSRIIRMLPHFTGSELVVAIFLLEDLLKMGGEELARGVEYFEQKQLGELERQLYARKLQEHAAKFPEKPLAEVRAAFETKENAESEIPGPEALDRAFSLYSDVVKEGEILIKLPDEELIRRLHLACAPFEANRKKLVKKDTHKKETGSIYYLKGSPEPYEEPAVHATQQEDLQEVSQDASENAKFTVHFFALLREFFKREFGVYPYNTQLIAILLMVEQPDNKYRGTYEQIKTGEGKSLMLALLASYFGVQGRRVDIITSNTYLAKRDAAKFQRLYTHVGLNVGHFDFRNEDKDVLSENPNIVYSTNHGMIFGYLSCRLANTPFFLDNRFDLALVDEADNLCIDVAQDSCRIAQEAPPLFPENVLFKFLAFADTNEKIIQNDTAKAVAEFKRFCQETASIHPVYVALYLRSALHSKAIRENIDFVIQDERIVIVDVHNTGRLQEKNQWTHGLHEFVTLRCNLPLPPHTGVQASMNHPSYLRRYQNLYCISGTFGDTIDREEIQEVYAMRGFDVPPHHASQRVDMPLTLVRNADEFLEKLAVRISTLQKQGRPILILTSSVHESLAVQWLLSERGFQCQILNDAKNSDIHGVEQNEDAIIRQAGCGRMITVATSVAGRGADIIPDEEAVKAGGLHSLLTFVPYNIRVEHQNRGRAGRQGKSGSSEILACAETDLFIHDALGSQEKEMIESLIDRYGPESPEARQMIDFLRKANNLTRSQVRIVNLEKDTLVEEALDHYFNVIAEVSSRLTKGNPVLNLHASENLSSFLVASYLSEQWTSEFEYVENVVRFADQMHVNGSGDNGDAIPEEEDASSPIQKKLAHCFVQIFGVLPESVGAIQDPQYRKIVLKVFRFFEERLLKLERKIRNFDKSSVAHLVRELERKVDNAAEECEGRFRAATIVDIKEYLAAREAKKSKGSRDDH